MDPVMARKMHRTLEPYHGMIHFTPDAGEQGCDELRSLVRRWSRALVASGVFGF